MLDTPLGSEGVAHKSLCELHFFVLAQYSMDLVHGIKTTHVYSRQGTPRSRLVSHVFSPCLETNVFATPTWCII